MGAYFNSLAARSCINIRKFPIRALDNFSNAIAEQNWSNVMESRCANESYNKFYEKFNTLFQQYFPLKKISVDKKHEKSPYITSALKKSITERNRLERLAKKWPVTYRETYRKYRNNLTSVLRAAKNMYHQNQLRGASG